MFAVVHLVHFAAQVDQAAIRALLKALLEARERQEIWFETAQLFGRTTRQVQDGLFGGEILTGDEGFSVAISFHDVAALDVYYAAPAHAAIRRTFLESISPEIAALYTQADAAPDQAKSLYAAIERAAASYMRRDDIIPVETKEGGL